MNIFISLSAFLYGVFTNYRHATTCPLLWWWYNNVTTWTTFKLLQKSSDCSETKLCLNLKPSFGVSQTQQTQLWLLVSGLQLTGSAPFNDKKLTVVINNAQQVLIINHRNVFIHLPWAWPAPFRVLSFPAALHSRQVEQCLAASSISAFIVT